MVVETIQFQMCSFIFSYEVVEFSKNGHGKSWKSYGILYSNVRTLDLCHCAATTVSICRGVYRQISVF